MKKNKLALLLSTALLALPCNVSDGSYPSQNRQENLALSAYNKQSLSWKEFIKEHSEFHPSLGSLSLEERTIAEMAIKASPKEKAIVVNGYAREGKTISSDAKDRREFFGNEIICFNGDINKFHGKYLVLSLIQISNKNNQGEKTSKILFSDSRRLDGELHDFYKYSKHFNILAIDIQKRNAQMRRQGVEVQATNNYVITLSVFEAPPEREGGRREIGSYTAVFEVNNNEKRTIW